MSKIRNRSVKVLPHDFYNILSSSQKDKLKISQREDYFGENIKDVNVTSPYVPFSKETPPQSFSTISNSDVDSITLELNKLSGLSSSSSLSWSDEYESETTKKVQEELERMDRVLRGEEPIPPHYDRDEYEQWINKFPNLCIFDRQVTPTNSTHNIPKFLEEKEDELVIYGSDTHKFVNKDCDTFSNTRKKQTVIDVSENISNRLLGQRSATTARKRKLDESKNKTRNIFTVSHKPRSLDTEKYLKISPIKNQLNERRLSSKSLLNRENSKDYSDVSPEYNSLPFIKVEELDLSKRNSASSRSQNRRKSGERMWRKKVDPHLVLPPIVASNQFRSISATPRNGNTLFSGISMKLEDNFKGDKTRKLSVSFLDPISNR